MTVTEDLLLKFVDQVERLVAAHERLADAAVSFVSSEGVLDGIEPLGEAISDAAREVKTAVEALADTIDHFGPIDINVNMER